jgi:DNA-directed RNA polymerase specialized sigma24 family protein
VIEPKWPDDGSAYLSHCGDRAALGALLERHQPLARRICQTAFGAADGLQQDALQEAVRQALLGLDTLRDPGTFGALAHRDCAEGGAPRPSR